MFERFTSRTRHAVVLAQEEAQRLNHNYIGTEHILLGLLGEPEGIAATVLAGFGVTRDVARREVTELIGTGKASPSGHIPFTPRAKKSMELSLREALALNHNYIGTEHILLGLMREGDGVAAQVLRRHGDLLAIRAAVLDAVPAGDADAEDEASNAMVRWLRRRLVRAEPADIARLRPQAAEAAGEPALLSPAGDATLSKAVRLAGTGPVGSQHLLLAALADTQSAAARALAALGLDLDKAREALRAADITGTTDEPPEEAGRRQLAIQVTGETLTLVATDPVLVAAGKSALAAVNTADAAGAAGAAGAEAGRGEGGAPEGEAPEGEAPGSGENAGRSATATVIRGDHPAAASLAGVWQELFKALAKIKDTATPPAAA